ncbi:RWD-domain-containing protein [Myriangium duriaei CBS 260.36]|uniref:RWD-domain-containing protein n=1 Tax=Myriangium duriaei CBS 260.36 TaxID=1168546 RepID=A0A9P4J3T9_9PEZI|nr:RWD-domain-containing protein [Myriangium duriaei CBS 260.36]
MGREDQTEEREVLESIFPDEITDISETEYRISIQLDIPGFDEEAEQPVILLQVQYPEAYPDEAPRLDIQNPPNAAKHPHLDVQDDKTQLLESLTSTIEENLGMAMVFTLVTTLKENAEQLIAKRLDAIQAEQDAAKAQAEAEENRKFEGTKVTRDTFLAWRDRFKKEMEEERARREKELEEEMRKKRLPKEERKMTGKELWEKGLAGKTVDEEEEGEDAIVEGMREVKVK